MYAARAVLDSVHVRCQGLPHGLVGDELLRAITLHHTTTRGVARVDGPVCVGVWGEKGTGRDREGRRGQRGKGGRRGEGRERERGVGEQVHDDAVCSSAVYMVALAATHDCT